jgi:hypothetical protein
MPSWKNKSVIIIIKPNQDIRSYNWLEHYRPSWNSKHPSWRIHYMLNKETKLEDCTRGCS